MKNRPIGIFDSGMGGLAIARVLKEQFKHENFIYIADLKNVPYGPKSQKEIRRYVLDIVNYFVEQNAKAVVVACNTASTEADDLDVDIPIVKMIEPTIKETLENNKNNNVLLLATEKTVNSKVYEKPLLDKGINLYQKAMPEFVLLVEDLEINTKKSHKVAKELLREFINKDIGTIILGCTHFGFLDNELLENFPNANLVSGANMVKEELDEKLKGNLNNSGQGYFKVYTTNNLEDLKKKVQYLNIDYDEIKKIDVEGVE